MLEPNNPHGTASNEIACENASEWKAFLQERYWADVRSIAESGSTLCDFAAKQTVRKFAHLMMPDMEKLTSEALSNVDGFLSWGVRMEGYESIEASPEPGIGLAVTQEYFGVVVSISNGKVDIEFTTDDDRELREFGMDELGCPGLINRGQRVRVRSQIEFLPPTRALSEEEASKWVQTHSAKSDYLGKSKERRPLLGDDSE